MKVALSLTKELSRTVLTPEPAIFKPNGCRSIDAVPGYKFVKDDITTILPVYGDPDEVRYVRLTLTTALNKRRDAGMPKDQLIRVGLTPMYDLDIIREIPKRLERHRAVVAEKLSYLPLEDRLKDGIANYAFGRFVVETFPKPIYKHAVKLFDEGFTLHSDHGVARPEIVSYRERDRHCEKVQRLNAICAVIKRTIKSTSLSGDEKFRHIYQLQKTRAKVLASVTKFSSDYGRVGLQ